MLRSTFSTLDHVVQTKDISPAEKNKLLKTQVEQYKKLRQQIVDMKSSMSADKKRSTLTLGETNPVGDKQNHHGQLDTDRIGIIALRHELSELKGEIKQLFRSEFKILFSIEKLKNHRAYKCRNISTMISNFTYHRR